MFSLFKKNINSHGSNSIRISVRLIILFDASVCDLTLSLFKIRFFSDVLFVSRFHGKWYILQNKTPFSKEM